jgi:ABC-type antimicrobial peptide transport system permease subunit
LPESTPDFLDDGHSVVSYTIAQRTNEFGIRIALGAQSGNLLRLVFSSALGSVGGGIVVGVGLSISLRVQGNVRDPGTLLSGVVLLLIVAAIATVIPARRVADVDPMTTLRAE